jgi:hypothetical protein
MVQIMESWFIADRQALVGFYKDCFYEGALPGSAENVEVIPKADVLKGLDSATRDSKKGKYSRNKRQHAQELLARINPARVQHSSAECARLFHCLREAINART